MTKYLKIKDMLSISGDISICIFLYNATLYILYSFHDVSCMLSCV